MLARIVKINRESVVIKNNKDKFVTVSKKELEFEYHLGDTIEIEKDGDNYYFLPYSHQKSMDDFWEDDKPTKKSNKIPEGFGGWLIVFIIHTVLSIILGFISLSNIMNMNYSLNCSKYDIFYNGFCNDVKPFLTIESVVMIILLIFRSIVVVYILFKRREARLLSMVMIAVAVAWSVIDYIIAYSIFNKYGLASAVVTPSMVGSLAGAIAYGCIWFPYFKKSKRVMRTLIK